MYVIQWNPAMHLHLALPCSFSLKKQDYCHPTFSPQCHHSKGTLKYFEECFYFFYDIFRVSSWRKLKKWK